MNRPSLPPVLGPDMRSVRRDLAGADDTRVLQVLRFVENLSDPTQAAALLAPLRDRLRVLRPKRPLRLQRVLFSPLDPVLVDPLHWRTGAPTLPRTTLAPFTTLIRAALADEIARAEAAIAGPGLAEDRALQAGRMIWAAAGEALANASPPPDWAETSISVARFADLARGSATVLQAAWKLHTLTDPLITPAELAIALGSLLAAAEPLGPVAWGMMLTVTLQAFPHSEAPWKAAAGKRANATLRHAAEGALEAAWGWVETTIADPGLGEPAAFADALNRQVGLLEELQRDPAHRKRAASLQAQLRTASIGRFESAVEALLIAPLRTPGHATPPRIAELEGDARALRRLDGAARRLGGGSTFDAALNQAAGIIAATTSMAAVNRARLVEILVGAPAAMRMLQG